MKPQPKHYYCRIDELRNRMNEAGAKRIPFLFAINYEMTEGLFVEQALSQSQILFRVKNVGNKSVSSVFPNVDIVSTPLSRNDYRAKFDIVHKGLRRGDSFLANLTIKTPIQINTSLADVFQASRASYQLYIPNRFVCFSPERFVRIADGKIQSNPMKGTIDANIENAEQIILNDFKETAEHNTIVDLIRNDLSIVARNVRVERFRYIDRIASAHREILQVSSEIVGDLSENYHSELGDILFALLPAGSICGAPKQATLDLIAQAEQEDRGYYTGIFGYFDGNTLDTGVLIRFIEQQDNRYYFRSGGGITAYSDFESEYDEVFRKIFVPSN